MVFCVLEKFLLMIYLKVDILKHYNPQNIQNFLQLENHLHIFYYIIFYLQLLRQQYPYASISKNFSSSANLSSFIIKIIYNYLYLLTNFKAYCLCSIILIQEYTSLHGLNPNFFIGLYFPKKILLRKESFIILILFNLKIIRKNIK